MNERLLSRVQRGRLLETRLVLVLWDKRSGMCGPYAGVESAIRHYVGIGECEEDVGCACGSIMLQVKKRYVGGWVETFLIVLN